MGQINTEQAVEIIDAVTGVIDATKPDEVVNVVQTSPAADPNYLWLLIIAVAPVVIIPLFLGIKKAFSKKKGAKK